MTITQDSVDLDVVAAIEDAEQRARYAAQAWEVAHRRVEQARSKRDAACLHLLRNEGWKPVHVYRLASLSRRLFGPIAARVPVGQPAPRVANAEAVVKKEGIEFWDAKAVEGDAAGIRTEAAQAMLRDGRTNADVARATRLSTARVTQIKKDMG